VNLDENESAVVGRAPDDRNKTLQAISLPSPNVSANHVTVAHRGEVAAISDLGSRNGTWLKLPPLSEVSVPLAHVTELSLHVAPTFESHERTDPPQDARWTGPDDYALSLQNVLGEWFAKRAQPARVSITTSLDGSDDVGRVPLATGHDLIITPLQTAGPGWLDGLGIIERYVERQNLLFETEQSMRDDGLIVASPALRSAVAKVIEAAASGSRVLLLTGASGTGKEGLARCFHRHTGRPGPFIARNCAMFSRELARTELFGAEKGSFTGSVQRIVGAVESANEGTLFLDELGELPRDVQPMLLRFLDHGEYERLGRGGVAARADVRIVCATNRNLRQAALADEFRTDLWFRLSVHVVEVPSLRDRPEDVVAYLRSRPRAGQGTLYDALAPDTLAMLAEHDWTGNFRELISFAARVELACPRGSVSADVARRALEEGALIPVKAAAAAPRETRERTIADYSAQAAQAYAADRDGRLPTTWDDVKDFVENYLKPLKFAELAGTTDRAAFAEIDLREAADRVRSDRGTAAKQLRRYFDRFRGIDS
jgi:DNA-binding NtrC family response regulator